MEHLQSTDTYIAHIAHIAHNAKLKKISKKKPKRDLTGLTRSGSLKFSVRIGDFVTSISIKKNICSLWLLLREYDFKNPKNIILDFIHASIQEWIELNQDTAKGFSDFITERMIKDILTKKDFTEYKRIHDMI